MRALRMAGLPAVVLALAAVAHRTRTDGEAHFLATQRYEDVYYLPPPQWLDFFSLGYREAVADLIWLRALIYFGDELINRGGVENLYNYTDAMLTLDPHFRRVYRWASTGALYRPGKITEQDALRAIGYLEQGVRLFPDDGEMAWDLAANYMYELMPLVSGEEAREEARRKGVEHLRVAALRGAGPPWLSLSVVSELGKLGRTQQELEHIQEVYAQVSDPNLKRELEARLVRLQSEAFAEAMRQTHQQIERERKANFPYLDTGLYLLVGKRPAFDGTALILRGFDPEDAALGQTLPSDN